METIEKEVEGTKYILHFSQGNEDFIDIKHFEANITLKNDASHKRFQAILMAFGFDKVTAELWAFLKYKKIGTELLLFVLIVFGGYMAIIYPAFLAIISLQATFLDYLEVILLGAMLLLLFALFPLTTRTEAKIAEEILS